MAGIDMVFPIKKISEDGRVFGVEVNRGIHVEFWSYVNAISAKHAGYVRLQIGPPVRPIKRGPRGQMNRHFGHCQDIADQLSTAKRMYTKEEVDRALRNLAVREGIPTVYNEIDDTVEPIHMSACSVEHANIIEIVKQKFCDEHSLYLTEYDETVNPPEPYRSLNGRTREEMKIYYQERGEVDP
jgi:hypothetical protein